MDKNRILEENLEKLFKRAYEPAPCRPEFRDALLERILHRVDLYHHHRILTFPVKLIIAAAVLAGVGFLAWELGWIGGAAHSPGSGGELVATPGKGMHDSIDPSRGVAESRRRVDGESRPSETSPNERLAADQNGSLEGVVVDANNLEKIQNARVTLVRESDDPGFKQIISLTIRDSNGLFQLKDLPEASYELFVQSDGYAPFRARGTRVEKDKTTKIEKVALTRGARLRGKVVNAETGLPVEGALVLSEPDAPTWGLLANASDAPRAGDAAALTGPGGFFDILHASAGMQQLRASKGGLAPGWTGEFVVSEHGETRDLVLSLTSGGGVRGKVTDSAGAPAARATVMAFLADTGVVRSKLTFASGETDAAGEYQIPALAAGDYTIVRIFDGGKVDVRPAIIKNKEWTEVHFNETAVKHALRGTVKSAGGAAPAGFTISVVPLKSGSPRSMSWKAAAIDAASNYQFTDLESGEYDIFLAAPFGLQIIKIGNVEIPKASDARFDTILETGEIRGKITDAATGEPVPQAIIILQEASATGPTDMVARVFTDARGNYKIPYLRYVNYQIIAFATSGNYAFERREDISVAAGAPAPDVNLQFAPGASIRVRVRDGSGAAVDGAIVRFFDEGGRLVPFSEPPSRTSGEGVFVASGVRPGRWRVEVEGGAAPAMSRWVEASVSGSPARIEFTIQK